MSDDKNDAARLRRIDEQIRARADAGDSVAMVAHTLRWLAHAVQYAGEDIAEAIRETRGEQGVKADIAGDDAPT